VPKSADVLQALSSGVALSPQDVAFAATEMSGNAVQIAALSAHIHLVEHSELRKALPDAAKPYLEFLETPSRRIGPGTEIAALVSDTCERRALGRERLTAFVRGLTEGRLPMDLVAVWCVAVAHCGLSDEDTVFLAESMANSGEIWDVRGHPALQGRRLLRRYPTGAVSEKIALVLPSLLASAAAEWPVATAFLVGRSLAFTGGTWDKLAAVPGFRFPDTEAELVGVLRGCGAAMTVTTGSLCPADRILYQLRSATATVNADALIVSSIASKQVAVPADLLLLDVRFGSGAFLENRTRAVRVAERIADIVAAAGTRVDVMLTPADEPNGIAVGNALEVAEALAILNPAADTSLWDDRALVEQRTLVTRMYARLMANEVPSRTVGDWEADAEGRLADGRALVSFVALLEAHGVEARYAAALADDPFGCLSIAPVAADVVSNTAGIICAIDQPTLGNAVNFDLGSGANQFVGTTAAGEGVMLACRLGDRVEAGDTLCWVRSHSVPPESLLRTLRECFSVDSRAQGFDTPLR
jgi:pyrimidine-nucleoside phosphorylase